MAEISAPTKNISSKQMVTTRQTRKAGRKEMDFAIRVRNLGWVTLVQGLSGLSDEKLEALVLPAIKGQGRKVFSRIKLEATSPDERMRASGGSETLTIYELVHAHKQFEPAREWFESQIWPLLTDPYPTQESLTEILNGFIVRNKWFRADRPVASVIKQLVGPQERMLQLGASDAHQELKEGLTARCDIDALTLMCTLFLEASVARDFEVAMSWRSALADLSFLEHRLKYPKSASIAVTLLGKLVERRLVHNDWSEPNVDVRGGPRDLIQSIVRYGFWTPLQPGSIDGVLPIIPRSIRSVAAKGVHRRAVALKSAEKLLQKAKMQAKAETRKKNMVPKSAVRKAKAWADQIQELSVVVEAKKVRLKRALDKLHSVPSYTALKMR